MSTYATPEWVKFPQDTVTLDGAAQGKVTGPVTITWTSARTAFVTTEAHHNDTAPAVSFRGREWLASAHFERDGSGRWVPSEHTARSDYAVTERGSYGSTGAPRTFRAAILEAMRERVQGTADASRLGLAERAAAAQALHVLDGERDRAVAELRRIDSERVAHLAALGLTDNRVKA